MDLDNLLTFDGLFSQYRFHIPDYQRGYSWEKPQWKALVDDLSTLTNHNDHFTGLLVIHETKNLDLKIKIKGVIKEVFEVVDGQQRLTTIVILLNEIRKEMERIGTGDLPEIAESIIDTYLYGSGAGTTLVPKLVLDQNNHDFFIHNILGMEGVNLQGAEIQSHKNLFNAQAYFREYLIEKNEKLGEEYSAWLEDIYEKIAQQMKVMVYRLHAEADAGVVFESMNNRGKAPNELDLVKNYLLYLASKLGPELNPKLTAAINHTWEIVFRQLTAAGRAGDEETLLQMHWLTVYDHDRKHWENEKDHKSNLIKRRFSLLDYIDRYDDLYQALEQYVQTLRNCAVAYCDLRKPIGSATAFQIFASNPDCRAEIIKFSEKLLRINIMRPFQPLLLAVRLRFPEDANKYLEIVKLCECYAFRVFQVAERYTTGKEVVLFRLANMLFNGKISFETMHENMRRDLLAECPDTLLQSTFAVENAVPWYGKRGLTYFLYEYEEHLFEGSKPIVNWQTIVEGKDHSIEHILPQHPTETGYWIDNFPDADERARLVHQVGNLTLVLPEENSSLGNRPFPEKKGWIGQEARCYANSDLKITRGLAGLENWTVETISTRQRKFAEWAQQRWFVPAPPPLPNVPWERMLEKAKQNGVEKEFLELREYADKFNLGIYVNSKSLAYKPKYNWTLSAITVGTYENLLWVYLRPHNFPVPKGFPKERVKEILGQPANLWLPPDKFSTLTKLLDQLLEEISIFKQSE